MHVHMHAGAFRETFRAHRADDAVRSLHLFIIAEPFVTASLFYLVPRMYSECLFSCPFPYSSAPPSMT